VEAGWTPEMSKLTEKVRKGRLYEFLRPLLTEIQNHPSAWPFLEPVNGQEVVDYYDVIKDPMDLKTMEEKLEGEVYQNIDQFIIDLEKIVANCRSYNNESSQYTKCADKIETFFNTRLTERKSKEADL
jgi:histone acetyltransferase